MRKTYDITVTKDGAPVPGSATIQGFHDVDDWRVSDRLDKELEETLNQAIDRFGLHADRDRCALEVREQDGSDVVYTHPRAGR